MSKTGTVIPQGKIEQRILLIRGEKVEVVANCDHLSQLKYSKALPHAFTEHGAIMAAIVLNSAQAIEMSVFIVRAFVKLRQTIAEHKEIASRLQKLERKIADHDEQILTLLEAIHQLMAPPDQPQKRIGFTVKERKASYGKKKTKKQAAKKNNKFQFP